MKLDKQLRKASRHCDKVIQRMVNVQSVISEQDPVKAEALDDPILALDKVRLTILNIAKKENVEL